MQKCNIYTQHLQLRFCDFAFLIKVIESPELEGTHKDHQSLTPDPERTAPRVTPFS